MLRTKLADLGLNWLKHAKELASVTRETALETAGDAGAIRAYRACADELASLLDDPHGENPDPIQLELAVMVEALEVLAVLEPAARQRALRWLTARTGADVRRARLIERSKT